MEYSKMICNKVKTPNIFTDNERKFDQPEQIPNAFNSYSTDIDPNLAAQIDTNIMLHPIFKVPLWKFIVLHTHPCQ